MEYDGFPETIELEDMTLVRLDDFKVGELSPGNRNSPSDLVRAGMLYEAERFFEKLLGERVSCTICSDAAYIDTFTQQYLAPDPDGGYYMAKSFNINDNHMCEALHVWRYDENDEETGDWFYIVDYS